MEDVKHKENRLAELLNMAIETEVVPSYSGNCTSMCTRITKYRRLISVSILDYFTSYPEEKILKIIENSGPVGETNYDSDTIISPEDLLNNSDENLYKNHQYCQMAQEGSNEEKVENDSQNEGVAAELSAILEALNQTEHLPENSNHFG